ncbi:MAG: DNA primase [Anaerolinea sp.]|nr:DNA primase [Anaerolinea sp.]
MTVTDEIKSRLNLEDIVAETVKLRRSGKSLSGFCPFHPNTRTPAFVVFPDTGTWRCFGQCNEGGDIFKYIMKREGMDFSQALKHLAERAGVQLTPPAPELERSREVSDRLENALEEASQFFRHQLIHTPAGKPAHDYLQQRGLQDPIMEAFGFGYAPDSWDALQTSLLEKGQNLQNLLDCGLLTERESGGYYDRFRNRIMIPIRSAEGKMTGFGARVLDPNDVPKFLNSPQTALFDKGRLLFGLDKARKSIRLLDQVVIVEGYLDVVALHQAGFTNAVSPMGTALTEDHLRLLKKYTRRIILALDADAAGEKATLRGLEVAREAMDHGAEVGFDVHGLLRHEKRLQADIRVTTLPEGMDPDEVVNRNPDEWKEIVSRAAPLVIHVMESLARSRDVNDPKMKSEIAATVVPLIEEVPSTVERDAYRQRLARLLRVSEEALGGIRSSGKMGRQSARFSSRNQRTDQPPIHPVKISANDPVSDMEKHFLALLVKMPELIFRLDRNLRQSDLEKISTEDFGRTELSEIFTIISTSLIQDEMEPLGYIQEQMDPAWKEDLTRITNSYNPDKINEDDMVNDLFHTIIRLRQKKSRENLLQLRYLQEEHQDQEEFQLNIPFQDQVLMNSQMLNKLERALLLNSQKRQI